MKWTKERVLDHVGYNEDLKAALYKISNVRRVRCVDCEEMMEKGEVCVCPHGYGPKSAMHQECYRKELERKSDKEDSHTKMLREKYNISPDEEYGMQGSIRYIEDFFKELRDFTWAASRLTEHEAWLQAGLQNPAKAQELANYYDYRQVVNDRTVAYYKQKELEAAEANTDRIVELLKVAKGLPRPLPVSPEELLRIWTEQGKLVDGKWDTDALIYFRNKVYNSMDPVEAAKEISAILTEESKL